MPKKTFKGYTALAPVPAVMVSCGSWDDANIITIAWTGTVNSDPPYTYVSVRKSRHSHALLSASGEFVINLASQDLLFAADKCGCVSGAKADKFEKCGLTKEKAEKVACPMIAECPVNIECRVFEVKEFPSHDMFLAEVVAVHVDDSLIDGSGRICMERAGLFAYIHGAYVSCGRRRLGSFGYSVMKKSTKKRLGKEGRLKDKVGAGLGMKKNQRPPVKSER